MEAGDVARLHPVVSRVVGAKVRNPDWRQEAEQEAWVGIVKTANRHGEVPEPLAVRIVINACHSVCRAHRRDPLLMGFDLFETPMYTDPGLNLDVQAWVSNQTPDRQDVLNYVLSKQNWGTLDDLAEECVTTKATASRALTSLRDFLTRRLLNEPDLI